MVNITVHITPPLTGVKGEMWIMFVVGGIQKWFYLLDIPRSVNGVIGPFGYADGYTYHFHQIRFPEQTISGTTYEAAQTGAFMTNQDWTFNITLTPKVEPATETSITIDAPPQASKGEKFFVSGILYENETGIPIPNKTINLSYNGQSLGSAITSVDGDYLKEVSIPVEGLLTLTAKFLGT